MKLLYLSDYNIFYHSNANSNRIRGLLEGLFHLGVNVEVLIYGGYQSSQEKETCGLVYNQNGIICKYFSTNIISGYFNIRFQKYISIIFKKSKIVNELVHYLKDYEGIIWTDLSLTSFSFAKKIKKKNTKCMLFLEMSEYMDIYKFSKGNILQKYYGKKRQNIFESSSSYYYDGIAFMTTTLYKYYAYLQTSHIKLLHLPMTVDLSRFTKQNNPLNEFKNPYIAYVGSMNDLKDGVSILISAFEEIKNTFNEYTLYLIGPYDYDTPNHLRIIEQKGLKNRVFWMNVYGRDKIPNIICNADLLVLPRPDSKQAQGGFPTKLGEYLATGKPVCATRVGEIPNYLTDNQSIFFAEPGSVESFAKAMERALSNTDNAIFVGANGRKVAEKEFNKITQAKNLFDFLKELKTPNPL